MPRSRSPPAPVTIGVLALQGAFHEHLVHLSRIEGVSAIPVRTPEHLALCSALIIPGGESTAIALGAIRGGLLEPLRDWVRAGRPVWGTCAGMIMLAREATGGKKAQELIGGWDGRVGRNGWGSQIDSFETPLDIPALSFHSSPSTASEPFPGVFIRAPVVERLFPAEELVDLDPQEPAHAGRRQGEELEGVELVQGSANGTAVNSKEPPAMPLPNPATYTKAEASSLPTATRLAVAPPLPASSTPRPPIEVIARLPSNVRPTASLPGPDADVVALRQGNVFATAFHPELTRDRRLHEWWVRTCVRGETGGRKSR